MFGVKTAHGRESVADKEQSGCSQHHFLHKAYTNLLTDWINV